MTLQLIWEEVGVVRKFSETLTAHDINMSLEEVHGDSRFSSLKYSINDFLEVTRIDVSKAALAGAAFRTIGDSRSNNHILVAIVATNPELTALADFYSSPAYMPYPAKLFSTVSDARNWIAVHP